MDELEPNPHLANEVPSSWDVPFKKWVFGLIVSLALFGWGVGDLIQGHCSVPVPQGKFHGVAWMQLSGAGARWFGLVQIGFSAFLHGRYFWKFHNRLWRYCEIVETGGIAVFAVSVVLTFIYLWKQHFFKLIWKKHAI